MQTMTEKDLVQEFRVRKERVDQLTNELDAAKKEFLNTERDLLELLQADCKERSAKYDGIGSVTVVKPRVYASCTKENEELLFAYLSRIGRDDLVKTAVNSQSLSSMVKEQLESGEEPPDFINYHLVTRLRLNS